MTKLYSVSDAYIAYLRDTCGIEHVFSNKEGEQRHTRKYLGIVLQIGNFKYFAPFSSPKSTDYIDGKIRRSTIAILRITNHSNTHLLCTVKLSNMIPVPDSELTLYDVNSETDIKYKNLVKDELRWVSHNNSLVLKNAKIIYDMKMHEEERKNPHNSNLFSALLPFSSLEKYCKEWEEK